MRLETGRLLLRPLEEGDLPHMQRYAVRPDFYRHIPIPEQTPESVAEFLHGRLERQRDPEIEGWTLAVVARTVGHIIGGVRIGVQNRAHRQADLGFSLDSDFRGHGFMSEAVTAVIAMGFDTLDLHRIWATADVDNVRSWQLMERVGIVREGRLRDDKWIRGRWRDSYLYATLADDLAS